MGSSLMKDTPVDAPCPRGLICLRSFKYDYITPKVHKALELNCLVSSLKDFEFESTAITATVYILLPTLAT